MLGGTRNVKGGPVWITGSGPDHGRGSLRRPAETRSTNVLDICGAGEALMRRNQTVPLRGTGLLVLLIQSEHQDLDSD